MDGDFELGNNHQGYGFDQLIKRARCRAGIHPTMRSDEMMSAGKLQECERRSEVISAAYMGEYLVIYVRDEAAMREVRTIIFEQPEVQSALVDFSKRRGTPVPAGVMTRFEVLGDPIIARLQISTDRGGDIQLTFSQIELAAALIAYCIDRKIPLPAKAQKEIQVMGGATVLLIRT